MRNLTPAQQDAATAEENILCCACPGSGKTTMLVAKARHVLERQAEARIILTTFSRDAANEMQLRLRKSNPPLRLQTLTIGTFHALALRQLKAVGAAGHILNQIEANHIILRALEEADILLPLDEAELAIATCKIDPSFSESTPWAARLTRIYQRELAARGACDFTDIIARANAMMAAGTLQPIPATHVFCDEFQDIDRLQFEWLSHHISGGRLVCAVGDDDQSIYGFRRSLGYRGMMEFVSMTGARIITLGENFRSTREILDGAGRLIGHNLDRVRKEMTAVRGPGHAPELVSVTGQERQLSHLVDTLSLLCRDNPLPPPRADREPYRFAVKKGQVAVLARANHQLDAIARHFAEHRIPYLRAGRSIWDGHVAQVFVSLLQSLHAGTGVGFEVALRWARVPDSLIRALADHAGGNLWGLIDPAGSAPETLPGGPVVSSLVKHGRDWARKLSEAQDKDSAVSGVIFGVDSWMTNVVKDTCEQDGEEAKSLTRRPRDLKDLALIAVVKDTLDGFNGSIPQRIALAREDDVEGIPRIILSTFHAAKGLEWDNVLLVDIVSGSVPKAGPEASDAEIEEERRVFYVAMTRARDRLFLYTYRKPGAQPSEFLIEAGLLASAQSPKQACHA